MYSDRYLYDYARERIETFQKEAEVERLWAAIKKADAKKAERKHTLRIGDKVLAVLQMFHFGGDLASADKRT